MMTFLVLLLPSHLEHLHTAIKRYMYIDTHLFCKIRRFSKLLKSTLEIENLFNNNELDIGSCNEKSENKYFAS